MNFTDLRRRAAAALAPATWEYYEGTADDEGPEGARRDEAAWGRVDLVPRVLAGLRSVDTAIVVGATALATPIVVAATAAHGLAHPDAEVATAAAAARCGALMVYSNSAAVEVGAFGARASGPWWAQAYVMTDLARTADYLGRCVEAGAGAIVLTVDNTGPLADAPFRTSTQGRVDSTPANYPGWTWPEMSAAIEPALTPDHIGWVADQTGLPVHVKGVLRPDDAERVVDAGAAGIGVSNHGRRQVAGVRPTAVALRGVIDAVGGRVPVTVDGGIRSGADVARALAIGARAAGIGRPVLWALAADGTDGVATLLATLTAELRQVLGAMGASSPADLDRSFVDLGDPGGGRRPGDI